MVKGSGTAMKAVEWRYFGMVAHEEGQNPFIEFGVRSFNWRVGVGEWHVNVDGSK